MFVFLKQGLRAPASVAKNEPLEPRLVLLFLSVSASLFDEAPKYEFTPASRRSDMRQYHAFKCGRSCGRDIPTSLHSLWMHVKCAMHGRLVLHSTLAQLGNTRLNSVAVLLTRWLPSRKGSLPLFHCRLGW